LSCGKWRGWNSGKINGRWYCYQRPLRLMLEVLCHKGNSFRFLASGSPIAPKDQRLAKLLSVSGPSVTLAVKLRLAHGCRCPAATLLFLFLMQARYAFLPGIVWFGVSAYLSIAGPICCLAI
jgi:hypothetical protein